MREYNKPTLEITKYTIAKVNICASTKSIVETESPSWISNGAKNGVENGIKD